MPKDQVNPKAVLTFGFEGHDDHVHVSNNMTGAPSQQLNINIKFNRTTSTDTYINRGQYSRHRNTKFK